MNSKNEISENNVTDTSSDELHEKLDEMVATVDTGVRNLRSWAGWVLTSVSLAWSLFQLWIASPFPYMLADLIPLLNSTHTRSAHLGFAIFLAFVAFPALKRSPRTKVPMQDWIFGLTGTSCALYIAVFSDQLALRPGLPITPDLIISGIGLVFLLEATRRALGLPMMCVALLFLSYVFLVNMLRILSHGRGLHFRKLCLTCG